MNRRAGDKVNTLLLVAVNVLTGLALWFGYSFAAHVTKKIDLHDAQISEVRTDVAVLKSKVLP